MPMDLGARLRDLAQTLRAPTAAYALRRYLVAGLVVLAATTTASVLVAQDLAARVALADASARGAAFAHSTVAPLVDAQLRAQSPAAQAQLARVVDQQIDAGSVIHVKLWDPQGRIVWSDERAIIGRTFELDAAVVGLFDSTGVTAEVSDLSAEENVQERPAGRLVEVYASMTDADGQPMVFESYWSTALMDADARTILARTTGLVVGSMVLLFAALLPLAITLAGRVDRESAHRAAFQRRVMAAADGQRRKVVEELHDGLIQDLSSLGYVIPTIAHDLKPEAESARTLLVSIEGQISAHISSLREVLREIYPPSPAPPALATAIEDMAHETGEAGVDVQFTVSPLLDTSADAAALTHRVVREALRNVVRHADAHTATVAAEVLGDRVRVVVRDDGVGIDDSPAPEGHFGLRLLADALRAADGRLDVTRGTGGGTVVTASFPLHPVTATA